MAIEKRDTLQPARPAPHTLRWVVAVIGGLALVSAISVFLLTRGAGMRRIAQVPTDAPEIVTPPVTAPAIPFTDITESAGLTFVHQNAFAGEMLLPETMGGGAAFFDYDNDGDPDLLLVNGAAWPWSASADRLPPGPALYQNDGTGRFTDVSASAGLPRDYFGTGVACGDFDGDGKVDLFLSALGPNHLLHNLGHGRFEEVTDAAGVAGEADAWSTSAGFFDYDRDGDLDLFVANYARWSPEADRQSKHASPRDVAAYGGAADLPGRNSYLYRNEGGGQFTDVSSEAGIDVFDPETKVPLGKALAVTFLDISRDGWLDIFVTNDGVRDFVFLNMGDGTFAERGALFGLGDPGEATKKSHGVSAGYYRDDEAIGVLVGRAAGETVALNVSRGERVLFSDDAVLEGLGSATIPANTFGALFLDADLDGRLDVLLANGHTEPNIAEIEPGQVYEQPSQLFWNAGRSPLGSFIQVPPELTGDLAEARVGRAAATADIDGDGDLDVIITQPGRRAVLLRNDQSLGHNWLRVALVGREGNTEAIGALVEVIAGGVTQRRRAMPTRSYLAQVEATVTFGLGEMQSVKLVRIIWPDDSVSELAQPDVNRVITVHQPDEPPPAPTN
ncbi:MAG: CRTAC1 family protein [Phycisphaerae bacterium]|nr:CRTAC1 family protein [Phycisphaerae bacterium]